jgi:hypothetical protein
MPIAHRRQKEAAHSVAPISSTLQTPQLIVKLPEAGVNLFTTSNVRRVTDEDIEMGDEDDLYGPLPEEVQLAPRRHKLSLPDMEVDHIEIRNRGTESILHHPKQPSINSGNKSSRETSWMHSRFAHITGDPWDRLLCRKHSTVVMRPRAKVQAKKLNIDHTIKAKNLVNFSIDGWVLNKRATRSSTDIL